MGEKKYRNIGIFIVDPEALLPYAVVTLSTSTVLFSFACAPSAVDCLMQALRVWFAKLSIHLEGYK